MSALDRIRVNAELAAARLAFATHDPREETP